MFAKRYTNIVSVNLFYKCGGDVSRCHILRNIMSARNTIAQVKNKFVDTIGSRIYVDMGEMNLLYIYGMSV